MEIKILSWNDLFGKEESKKKEKAEVEEIPIVSNKNKRNGIFTARSLNDVLSMNFIAVDNLQFKLISINSIPHLKMIWDENGVTYEFVAASKILQNEVREAEHYYNKNHSNKGKSYLGIKKRKSSNGRIYFTFVMGDGI